MKAVVFYELGKNVTFEKVMEVYPRHKKIVDAFALEGRVIAIGPFANPTEGSMGIFIDKKTAEDFVSQDPFVIEGVAGKVTIKEWKETLLDS